MYTLDSFRLKRFILASAALSAAATISFIVIVYSARLSTFAIVILLGCGALIGFGLLAWGLVEAKHSGPFPITYRPSPKNYRSSAIYLLISTCLLGSLWFGSHLPMNLYLCLGSLALAFIQFMHYRAAISKRDSSS